MSNFRGTSLESDSRFTARRAAERAARAAAPAEFSQRVNMLGVNKRRVFSWLAQRLTETIGVEDDITQSMLTQLLDVAHPDAFAVQSLLEGVIDKQATPFTLELWRVLLAAQASPLGVPPEWLGQSTSSSCAVPAPPPLVTLLEANSVKPSAAPVVSLDALIANVRAAAAERERERLANAANLTTIISNTAATVASSSNASNTGAYAGATSEDVVQERRSTQTRSEIAEDGRVDRREHVRSRDESGRERQWDRSGRDADRNRDTYRGERDLEKDYRSMDRERGRDRDHGARDRDRDRYLYRDREPERDYGRNDSHRGRDRDRTQRNRSRSRSHS